MKDSAGFSRSMAATVAVVTAALLVIAGALLPTPALADNGGGQSDHALLDNQSHPGPDTAIYCGVGKHAEPYTLHVSATAASSAGTLTIRFSDNDSIRFAVPAGGSFSMTQALGGVPGVDTLVKITVGGGVDAAMASVLTRPEAVDPFTGDGEKDNFCLTKPGDPGQVSPASVFFPI